METTVPESGGLIAGIFWQLWGQAEAVLRYPLNVSQRIHFLYLASAVIFALFVFTRLGRNRGGGPAFHLSEFLEFLFPKTVWKDPSAWLDVRYFFFHNFIWVSVFGTLGVAVTQWSTLHTTEFLLARSGGQPVWFTDNYFLGGIVYMFLLLLAIDFTAYVIHYLQHKIPLLWAFHKVHHSATVLHPLTNYREHPIDNVAYIVGVGTMTGVVGGFSNYLFGGIFRLPTIMGLAALAFAFNFLAYNLRHSHIWLRWPGGLSYVFGSPAHHQVHHSYHPDHIDRNFAFMFPVWDLIFGTWCLPKTNKDVKFGLGNGEEGDFRSCIGLYLVPFRKLLASWREKAPSQT